MLPLGAYQAIFHIPGYGVVKEERLLLNESDLGPPRLEIYLVQILITYSDRTRPKEQSLHP
jgi:hypothetical protein